MYASIRRYVVHPGSMQKIAKQVNEGFLPIVRNIPGFAAYYVVDVGNGLGISISIFEDQDGAERSAAEAKEYIRENLASLFPNPPEIMDGEVLVKSP
ncbi:MAG: hypothetical protein V3T85_04215 [Acidiferrobacterales bacterium]